MLVQHAYREVVQVDRAARAPGWVLPGEPVPVRLMNTIWANGKGVHDDLVDASGLAAWLAETGFTMPGTRGRATSPAPADVELARKTRDALRRLAAAATGDERHRVRAGIEEDDAVRMLNTVLASLSPQELVRADGSWRLDRPSPSSVQQALGEMAEAAAPLLRSDGSALRACYAPRCVLYFVKDHPRREWCGTACGNRARAARHYARNRPDLPRS